MGDDRIGSSSFGKSVRSLLDALASLEKEFEFVFERTTGAGRGPADSFFDMAGRFFGGGFDLGSVLKMAGADGFPGSRGIARVLGVADERSVDEVRRQVHDLLEQVARLREREVALAGGLSQLRSRAAKFDEAIAGLARIQGRCAAKLGTQADRAERVERMAGRRDDHITRLIRDTASQRAEIERVAHKVEQRPSAPVVGDDLPERLSRFEKQLSELRSTQKSGVHTAIETLEQLRDRIGRLEARAAEMSREARAKTGRLDALARHVSTVESRLASAIGGRRDKVVPVAAAIDPGEGSASAGPS